MEKRALFALVLSFGILIIYPHFLRLFYPEYGLPAQTPPSQETMMRQEAPTQASGFPQQKPFAVSPVQKVTVPQTDDLVTVELGPYLVGLSRKYASLSRVAFREFIDAEEKLPLVFLDAQSGSQGVGAVEILIDGQGQDLSSFQTQERGRSIFSNLVGDGFTVTKLFEIDKSSYGNRLRVVYKNTSNKAQDIQIKILAGSGLVKNNTIDLQYFSSNWIGANEIQHIKPIKEGKIKTSERTFLATSIKNRHFSSILKQESDTAYISGVQGLPAKQDRDFASFIVSPPIRVGPQETWSDEFLLYIGPNSVKALEPYQLDIVVNFGKLDSICKFLVGGMQLVHGVVKNYGVSIILLTLILNVIMLPLTKASFKSMKRMQLVQPQMATLREKYKKDHQKLNKEMTQLYKKYKVNPMGGCLPLLLQMPIFIALYVALSKSADLLNAKFLWINDLASPDIIPLPFELPVIGDNFHLLPLLTAAMMFVQQKISTSSMTQSDPNVAQQQKMMMYFMPIFLGFIFYAMPSGLVLYWLTNTVAMTGIHASLRSSPVEPA
jgi:YidC/Oxa1 family membrane protein insertase